jgi:hypothetical protein
VLDFKTDGSPHLDALAIDSGITRRAADIWAEVELRRMDVKWRASVEQKALSRPYPNAKRAMDVWGGRGAPAAVAVIKYGRLEHMVDFVERGRLRLTPASSYADESLVDAVRDSELEFARYLPPGTRLSVELKPGSGIFEELPIRGLIKHTNQCPDYYMFCASALFNPRAFDDFGYDACVLIHDYRRLVDLISVQRVPARKLSTGAVQYLDPYMPHENARIEFTKHFRYGYQREWRIIWTEPLPTPPLQPYFLELGNLSSFCALISL